MPTELFTMKNRTLPTRLFISATNLRTGKIKVSETADLTPEVVLASVCSFLVTMRVGSP